MQAMVTQQDKYSYFQRWWFAIRPKTLSASVAPVLVGCAVAFYAGSFRWIPVFAILFASILIQIGANLVNDVVDYKRGTDKEDRLGPMRVTQAGLLTPRQVWIGSIVVLALAALAGIYLVVLGGIPILITGMVCILAAVAYSTGPFPLSRNGLGDLFAFLLFGILGVCGTTYLVAGFLPSFAWVGGAGVGVLVTAILIVNNIRDRVSDRRAGRTNIPILFGRKGGEVEYAAMLLIAFFIPFLFVFHYQITPWVFITWLALPVAANLMHKIHSAPIDQRFNRYLAQTAQLLLIYSVLLSAGLVIGRVLSAGLIPQ